ncbi:hypothetical protein, partial [uncultured Bradyrhizobium sp.]|uniref:hypothetical protein n=1 Tax=uncultured Bradyrhizobium sp. TaxID=199684 RepID=UPI00262A45FE
AHRQFDEIFLRRAAGPYIRVKLRRTHGEQNESALARIADVKLDFGAFVCNRLNDTRVLI